MSDANAYDPEADEGSTPYEGGLFGIAQTVAGWGPRLTDALIEEDRRRQYSLLTLATRWPQAIAGFDGAVEVSNTMIESTPPLVVPIFADLIRRARNNLLISIDGVLARRDSVIMDTCRDQMEIAALAQDFLHEPQRITKWMSGKDRVREFGFQKLIRKYETNLLVLPRGGREKLLREYSAHSENLHPAYDGRVPITLPKAFVPVGEEWWLPVAARETLHHFVGAAAQIEIMVAYHLGMHDVPRWVIGSPEDSRLNVGLAALNGIQASMFPVDGSETSGHEEA